MRAYEIWMAEGCPDQRDFDHWLRAEKEVLSLHSKSKRAAPERKTLAPKRAKKSP